MSRVFLSHSHHDAVQAVALKRWLEVQEPGLAGEIFLDLDPHTGLAPGERWKEALQRANARCEAVISLLSARWEASAECRVEYRSAEAMGKLIFCARLEPEATGEVTAQWQRCDLFGPGPVTEVPVELEGTSTTVVFRTEGLERLLLGLRRAGVGAEHFPWPPGDDLDRAPYRGWEPLEEADAAVFFGRDTAILRGLDALRGMRTTGTTSLFVILGPSGVGKSSFLRAGLLPRLRRDDRHFVVLELMRPERAALTGDKGFASALHRTRTRLGLKTPALGAIKAACTAGDTTQLRAWVAEVRQVAAKRLPDAATDVPAPTVVLPVDQAEELFSVDAGAEAPRFLELLAEMVHTETGTTPGLIVAETIRADLYEPLQTAPALAQVRSVVFDDLRPLPRAEFKDVITGPAERATTAGRALELEPALVDRLLADSDQGADTLPLLALTLARLYRDYGTTGSLTVGAYEAMGGMGQVVQSEINALLGQDPAVRQAQLDLLRAAFVPWLATINPDNDQPIRRVAHLDDLPAVSRPLIEAMVRARLLVKDIRGGVTVIEVALESLLRQWDDLARWLTIERRNLIEADTLERAAAAWEDNGQDEAWLIQGQRLATAETLTATPHFTHRLRAVRPFLEASREHEDERAAAEQRRQEAELHAAHDKQQTAQEHATALRRRSRVLMMVLTATVVIAMVAVTGFALALQAREEADVRAREATALRLTAEAEIMLTGARAGGDARALQQMLIAYVLDSTAQSQDGLVHGLTARPHLEKIMEPDFPDVATALSFDGDRVASVDGGQGDTVRVWNTSTGEQISEMATGHPGENFTVGASVAFSPDETRIVAGGDNGTVRVWDTATGEQISEIATEHESDWVSDVALSSNGARAVTSGWNDGTVRVWDTATGEQIRELVMRQDGPSNVALSRDGTRVVSGGEDGTVRIWNVDTGEQISEIATGHQVAVLDVALSSDETRVLSSGWDGTVRAWETTTGKPVGKPMIGSKGPVSSMRFSPDGTRVVSGGQDDGTVRVWDVATGEQISEIVTGDQPGVSSVAWSSDGTQIVSLGGNESTVRVWDLASREMTGKPLVGHEEMVSRVAFRPQGDQIVSLGLEQGTVRVWDTSTGQQIRELTTNRQGQRRASGVALSSDGDRVVTSRWDDGVIQVWDTSTGNPIGKPLAGLDLVYSKAVSSDGSRVVSGADDGTVRVWDTATGEQISEIATGHENGGVSNVALSRDGTRAVPFGWDDEKVRVWDTSTGEQISEIATGYESGGVSDVALSSDGTRAVSSGRDSLVRVWDASTGEQISEIATRHQDGVSGVALSSDGTRIVSGGWDGSVQVWETATGKLVGEPMTGHQGTVTSVALSSDGTRIVSGGVDKTVRMWADPVAWDDLLCDKLTHNISAQQWDQWVSPDIDYVEACPNLPIRSDTADS